MSPAPLQWPRGHHGTGCTKLQLAAHARLPGLCGRADSPAQGEAPVPAPVRVPQGHHAVLGYRKQNRIWQVVGVRGPHPHSRDPRSGAVCCHRDQRDQLALCPAPCPRPGHSRSLPQPLAPSQPLSPQTPVTVERSGRPGWWAEARHLSLYTQFSLRLDRNP